MARVRISEYEAREDLLPSVCMQCGAPATVFVSKRFAWSPGWVILLVFCGLLPLLIVWLITTKRMRVIAPMCGQHANHWSWRSRYIWVSLLLVVVACIAIGIAVANLNDNQDKNVDAYIGFGCLGVGIIWLITAALVSQSGIRPDEITASDITLIKVSPLFVDALEDDRDRERGRKDRDRDDDDDDRPRKPRWEDHRRRSDR